MIAIQYHYVSLVLNVITKLCIYLQPWDLQSLFLVQSFLSQSMETGRHGDPGACAVRHVAEGLKNALVPAPIPQWPMVESHVQDQVK